MHSFVFDDRLMLLGQDKGPTKDLKPPRLWVRLRTFASIEGKWTLNRYAAYLERLLVLVIMLLEHVSYRGWLWAL